jgi:hypothetical protein
MASDDVLVIPAWCDPDRRRVRWSWEKCWIGLLYVDHGSLAYATTDGVMISASLQDVTVEWRGGSAVTTHRFDLHIPGHSYRFYLSRPSATGPAFNPKLVDQIGDGLSTAGGIGQLASAVGNFSKPSVVSETPPVLLATFFKFPAPLQINDEDDEMPRRYAPTSD